MIRKLIRLATALLAVSILIAAPGCSDSSNQHQRLVCEVESVNDGNPLVCAYLNSGSDGIVGTEDDYLPIDIVPVVFHARPFDSDSITLVEDGVYSYFDVTSYDLIWHPGPDAPAALTDYDIIGAPCNARVPMNDVGSVAVLIADRGMKEQPWFVALYNDLTLSYQATAELVFHGHETGSETMIDVPAGLQVTFYGVVSTQH
jgi:hypothetical protein